MPNILHKWHCVHIWHWMPSQNGIVCTNGIVCIIGIAYVAEMALFAHLALYSLHKWHCTHIWHCLTKQMALCAQLALCEFHKWHCMHNWHCMHTLAMPPLTPHPTLCLQVCPSYLRLFRWLIEESASVAQPDTDMGLSVSLACVTWGGARPRGRLVLAAVKIASVKYPWVDRNCCLHTSQRSESLYTSWSLCRYKSCH